MDSTKLNLRVKINRSDGRVQAAVMSSLDSQQKMVDVELLEDDEGWHTTIDLTSLLHHKPEIAETPETTAPPPASPLGKWRAPTDDQPPLAKRTPSIESTDQSTSSVADSDDYEKGIDDMTAEELARLKIVKSKVGNADHDTHFTYVMVKRGVLEKTTTEPGKWKERFSSVVYCGETRDPPQRLFRHRTRRFGDEDFQMVIVRKHSEKSLRQHQEAGGKCTTTEELGFLDEFLAERLQARNLDGYCPLVKYSPGRGPHQHSTYHPMATAHRVHEFMSDLDKALRERQFIVATEKEPIECPQEGCGYQSSCHYDIRQHLLNGKHSTDPEVAAAIMSEMFNYTAPAATTIECPEEGCAYQSSSHHDIHRHLINGKHSTDPEVAAAIMKDRFNYEVKPPRTKAAAAKKSPPSSTEA